MGPLRAFLGPSRWWDGDIDCEMAWSLQLLDGNNSHLLLFKIIGHDSAGYRLNDIDYRMHMRIIII